MKRYLLFAGEIYYPGGGWDDFRGDFDSPVDTVDLRAKYDWYHIVDLEAGREVESGNINR